MTTVFSTSSGRRLSWPTGRGEQVMLVTSSALSEAQTVYPTEAVWGWWEAAALCSDAIWRLNVEPL